MFSYYQPLESPLQEEVLRIDFREESDPMALAPRDLTSTFQMQYLSETDVCLLP